MTVNTTLARLQQLLPQLFKPVIVSGDPYLRCQLTPDIPALLSMEQVEEAVLVPASSVSPLPNTPAFTIGVMSVRDRVFCVVDLGQLLGLPPMPTNFHDYQVVVIRVDSSSLAAEKYLGLAVCRIRGVARFEEGQLRLIEKEDFPACLEPYLQGCFIETSQKVLILDTVAITNSPALLTNPFVQS